MECNLACADCTCSCDGKSGDRCANCKTCNANDQHGKKQA